MSNGKVTVKWVHIIATIFLFVLMIIWGTVGTVMAAQNRATTNDIAINRADTKVNSLANQKQDLSITKIENTLEFMWRDIRDIKDDLKGHME